MWVLFLVCRLRLCLFIYLFVLKEEECIEKRCNFKKVFNV